MIPLPREDSQAMGSWYLSITVSIVLILMGLATHWIVTFAGILMLFIPTLAMLISRRRIRRTGEHAAADPDRQ